MVRHAVRHVRASMEQMLTDFLVEYGWKGPTPPYGAEPFTIVCAPPRPADLKPAAQGNTVFISHGDEDQYVDTQLGGGILQAEHILFVDVVSEKPAIALAVAADIKDRLCGLFGGSRFLRPVDAGTGVPLSGFLGEFVDVIREQPNPDVASWQSIKATLQLEFPGDIS